MTKGCIVLRAALLVAVGVVLAVVLLWQADRLIRRMSIDSEPIVVPSSTPGAADGVPEEELELEIVTLLPFDAIPAISNPTLITADEADSVLDPDEQVMGISINGEQRAYSVRQLSRHEIVNDTVGGVPLAATW